MTRESKGDVRDQCSACEARLSLVRETIERLLVLLDMPWTQQLLDGVREHIVRGRCVEFLRYDEPPQLAWRHGNETAEQPEMLLAKSIGIVPEKLLIMAPVGAFAYAGVRRIEAEDLLTLWFAARARDYAQLVVRKMKRDGVWEEGK